MPLGVLTAWMWTRCQLGSQLLTWTQYELGSQPKDQQRHWRQGQQGTWQRGQQQSSPLPHHQQQECQGQRLQQSSGSCCGRCATPWGGEGR